MNSKPNIPRKVMAKICWVSAAEGGREPPPIGSRYSTVARFEQEAEKWPKEAWSIVAEFTKKADALLNVEAELRFLAPDAPSHLLQPGNKFELFEGSRLVARGEILRDGVEPLPKISRTESSIQMQEAL